MRPACGVRLFLPVDHVHPSDDLIMLLWGLSQRVGLRAVNIGHPEVAGTRWDYMPEVWLTPAPVPYINVVAAPLGMTLGMRHAVPIGDEQEVIWQPARAFGCLWTARVVNVACVLPPRGPAPVADEHDPHLADLMQYDRVFALGGIDAERRGVRLERATPEFLIDTLEALCRAREHSYSDS